MIRLWFCALALVIASPLAHAQGEPADEAALQAVTGKLNAYVALMNRTLRASESIERYESWVDREKGPVNKNRAFGVYDLHDVTDEIAEAKDALAQEPKLAPLDASMSAYIDAYATLAPIIDEANGYYESKAYLDDNLARGQQIHKRLVPAAKAFLTARATVERDFQAEQSNLARRELAVIERIEGRKAAWHKANLMIAARQIVDSLPNGENPVAEMAAVEAAVTGFADASKAFEDYRTSDPKALASLHAGTRSFLAASREFRDAIKPVNGDIRRGGGQQLQAVVNAYNALAGSANNAAE